LCAGRHAGHLANMAEIGEEPIRHVDHRVSDAGEARAQLSTRVWELETRGERSAMLGRQLLVAAAQHLKPEKRVADGAADPDPVARLGTVATDFPVLRDLADRGQSEHNRP